ncbi:MAG: hypothetical protein AAFN07_16910, partial [Pseudomonadota bacterium]
MTNRNARLMGRARIGALLTVLLASLAFVLSMPRTQAEPSTHEYAFQKFVGTWTLEDDAFFQVWDGQTLETLTIPNHWTNCEPVNTRHSILCAVDAGELQGHILWVVGNNNRSVRHLSHFGDRRVGVGAGQLDDTGNLSLKLTFEDEPEGTYRLYSYRWIDNDRYEMKSLQYDQSGQATGNWYGGT